MCSVDLPGMSAQSVASVLGGNVILQLCLKHNERWRADKHTPWTPHVTRHRVKPDHSVGNFAIVPFEISWCAQEEAWVFLGWSVLCMRVSPRLFSRGAPLIRVTMLSFHSTNPLFEHLCSTTWTSPSRREITPKDVKHPASEFYEFRQTMGATQRAT